MCVSAICMPASCTHGLAWAILSTVAGVAYFEGPGPVLPMSNVCCTYSTLPRVIHSQLSNVDLVNI